MIFLANWSASLLSVRDTMPILLSKIFTLNDLNLYVLVVVFRYKLLLSFAEKLPTIHVGYIANQLEQIAKTMGITEKEALKRLFADDVDAMKKAEDRWKEIETRLKMKHQEPKRLPRKIDSAKTR